MHAEIPEIPKIKSKSGVSADRPLRRLLCEPEMLVALVALAIGLCSLLLGFYEAGLQRHHARAAVWPHLEILIDNTGPDASIRVRNSGIGPAVIEDMVVTVDQQPMRSWQEVVSKTLAPMPPYFQTGTLTDRVLRAGDEVTLLAVPLKDLPPDLTNRVARVGLTIVYSSVFDEHWRLDLPVLTGKSRVTPTKKTKLPGSADTIFW